MNFNMKIPVHVEVHLKANCMCPKSDVVKRIKDALPSMCPIFANGPVRFENDPSFQDEIFQLVDSIEICDLLDDQKISFWQAEICLHAFSLSEQGPEADMLEGEEELPACEQWELPNTLLIGLWDSIIINQFIKNRLLAFCSSSIQFADAHIDSNIISWNRIVLLHGPPGTGKTSICKALAQKMYVRNCDRYSSGMLLEVNSHSLFSKWFSESGKLVMKLFEHIADVADDEECLVVVLIDEVESISASRTNSSSGNEPGDAVRVVNAVLTSLDALRRRPNVLVLCTSNMVDTLDSAFLDRVDLKIFLGPPNVDARYKILLSCLVELTQKGVISPVEFLNSEYSSVRQSLLARVCGGDMSIKVEQSSEDAMRHLARRAAVPTFGSTFQAEEPRGHGGDSTSVDGSVRPTDEGDVNPLTLPADEYLYLVAARCDGMSGRALRKLPIKAHAMFLQRPLCTLQQFIAAMHAVVGVEGRQETPMDDDF